MQPICKFTRMLLDLLNEKNLSKKYGAFDIMTDPELREGLKVFSQWDTYP